MYNKVDFTKNVGINPGMVNQGHLPECDQFPGTEFFQDDNGMMLADFDVFARSQADPELQKKIRQYMVEQDVRGFDPETSDEDVFNSIQTKYDSNQGLLDQIKNRIRELRANPPQKEE